MPKAVGYRIVIEIDKTEDKIGSIYLPEATKLLNEEFAESGVVKEIGPLAFKMKESNEPWVKVGDRVFFKARGNLFRYKDGRKIRVINDEDIICLADDYDTPEHLI